MTADAVLSPLLRKEFRALMPAFLATAAIVIAGRLLDYPSLMVFAAGGYLLGTATLGALAVGHEYTYATLGMLLAQPSSRRRLLQAKLTALALLLASLLLVAILWRVPIVADGAMGPVVLPPLLGLCVAPWLTMITRSALAGTVFSIGLYAFWSAVPALPWLSGVAASKGAPGQAWLLLAALCTGTALVGWRAFMRLESIEVFGGLTLRAPSRTRAASPPDAAPRRRPIGALLSKELRLQQATFIVAGLYVLIWTVTPYIGNNFDKAQSLRGVLTTLVSGLLAMLTGSLASAEERAMGTLTCQNVLPYAVRKQWAIKALTAFALTFMLAVILPSVLDALSPGGNMPLLGVVRAEGSVPILLSTNPWTMVGVLLTLTATALYISSLSTNSLSALLITPVLALLTMGWTGAAAQWSDAWMWQTLQIGPLMRTAAFEGLGTWGANDAWWWWNATRALKTLASATLIGVLTTLAFRHHRSERAGTSAAIRQVTWLIAGCLAGGLFVGAFGQALLWVLATR